MTPREFGDRLAKRARRAGVALEPSIVESLAAYYQLLGVWNKKINLTAFPLSEGQDEAFDRLLIEPRRGEASAEHPRAWPATRCRPGARRACWTWFWRRLASLP